MICLLILFMLKARCVLVPKISDSSQPLKMDEKYSKWWIRNIGQCYKQ